MLIQFKNILNFLYSSFIKYYLTPINIHEGFGFLSAIFLRAQNATNVLKFSNKKFLNNQSILLGTLGGITENSNTYYIFFTIFCLLLLVNCIYFYNQLPKWLSPYNLIIYSKKQLLGSFILYYFSTLLIFLSLLYTLFSKVIISFTTPTKMLLILFFTSLISLSFIVILRIKILQEQFSLKLKKIDEYENFGINFNYLISKKNKLLNSLTNPKFTENQKQHIKEKLTLIEKYQETYNENNENDKLLILTKKISASRKLKMKWMGFYVFLLNLFLTLLLFYYFYYFNINFKIGENIINSYYICICLLIFLTYFFIQNYLILFIINNNHNGDQLAIFTYFKNEKKYIYFGASEDNKIAYILITTITFIIIFFYILLNYRIITMIFNQIYLKNRLSLIETFFNIPFKPIFKNINLSFNQTFYEIFAPFMSLLFIFIISLISIFFLQTYFKILSYIYLDKLTKTFLNQEYSIEPLLTNELEYKIKTNLNDFKYQKDLEIGKSYFFDIICFKNLKSFFKLNYEKHKILSFNFIKYNFYFILIPTIGILFLLIVYILAKYYINIYNDLTTFVQLGGTGIFKRLTITGRQKLIVKTTPQRYTKINTNTQNKSNKKIKLRTDEVQKKSKTENASTLGSKDKKIYKQYLLDAKYNSRLRSLSYNDINKLAHIQKTNIDLENYQRFSATQKYNTVPLNTSTTNSTLSSSNHSSSITNSQSLTSNSDNQTSKQFIKNTFIDIIVDGLKVATGLSITAYFAYKGWGNPPTP